MSCRTRASHSALFYPAGRTCFGLTNVKAPAASVRSRLIEVGTSFCLPVSVGAGGANRIETINSAPFSFHSCRSVNRHVGQGSLRLLGNRNCSRYFILGGPTLRRLSFTTAYVDPSDKHEVSVCAARPKLVVCANGCLPNFANVRNAICPHHDTIYFRARYFPSAPGGPRFPSVMLHRKSLCGRAYVCRFDARP